MRSNKKLCWGLILFQIIAIIVVLLGVKYVWLIGPSIPITVSPTVNIENQFNKPVIVAICDYEGNSHGGNSIVFDLKSNSSIENEKIDEGATRYLTYRIRVYENTSSESDDYLLDERCYSFIMAVEVERNHRRVELHINIEVFIIILPNGTIELDTRSENNFKLSEEVVRWTYPVRIQNNMTFEGYSHITLDNVRIANFSLARQEFNYNISYYGYPLGDRYGNEIIFEIFTLDARTDQYAVSLKEVITFNFKNSSRMDVEYCDHRMIIELGR